MNEKFIINILKDSYSEVLKGKSQFLFFNTFDEEKISNGINEFINLVGNDNIIFDKTIQNLKYAEPYYPFLDFLKTDKCDVYKLIEKSGIYYYNKQLFRNYFLYNQAKSNEDMFFALNEIEYEKEKIVESICKMYYKMSKEKKIILVLKNIHFLDEYSFSIIINLLKNKSGNIFIVFTFNYEYYKAEKNLEFNSFIDKVKKKFDFINLLNENQTKMQNQIRLKTQTSHMQI